MDLKKILIILAAYNLDFLKDMQRVFFICSRNDIDEIKREDVRMKIFAFKTKTIWMLFPMALGIFLLFHCTNHAIVDDENEKRNENGGDNLPLTYSAIETIPFVLPSECSWVYTIPEGKSSGLSIINSQEDLLKHILCGETSASVDFDNYSLLLAYGDTLSNVHILTHQLVQVAENEYLLNVYMQMGPETWTEGWIVSILISKIPQNTIIKLNEVRNQGNPEEDENPYMDDIAGTWKLLLLTQETDSLECSDKNVIYEFREDGKLIVTGSDDLTEGEHTYEYKKLNVCQNCPTIPNMRIDDDGELFCYANLQIQRMVISGQKTENGRTEIWNKEFVKVEKNAPNDGNSERNENNNCEWTELNPVVLTEQLKNDLDIIFSDNNELVKNIKGDTLLYAINSKEELLEISLNINTVIDIDFENQSIIWGRFLTSSISNNITSKQLSVCHPSSNCRYEISVEKCTECWAALGYLYYWAIYPRKINIKNVSLIINEI